MPRASPLQGYLKAHLSWDVLRMYVFNPLNIPFFTYLAFQYALLFPNEVLDRVSPSYTAPDSLSPKESIWALYCRSMLLWHYVTRLSHSNSAGQPLDERSVRIPQEDLAELAQESWCETQAIEDSLDIHTCNLDTTLMYCCREYVFKYVCFRSAFSGVLNFSFSSTRMTVAQIFRHLHGVDKTSVAPPPGPMFSRKQAESWRMCRFLSCRINVELIVPSVLSGRDYQTREVIYGES